MQNIRKTARGVAVVGALAATSIAQAKFGAPEALTTNGKSMTGILYPSPALRDIDGDGKSELLIGDLRGFIQVAEGDGLAWGKLEQLKSGKEPLKLHNW